MPKLQDISDIPSDAVELLEAVGYLDAHDLSDADTDELCDELVKANDKLQISVTDPTADDVRAWQKIASGRADNSDSQEDEEADEEVVEPIEEATEEAELEEEEVDTPEVDDDGYVNFEKDDEVLEMLAMSPEALILEPSLIRRHKLKVADIPEGLLLTRCKGEVEINVMTSDRLSRAQRREAELKRAGLIASRVRNFENADGGEIKPLDRGAPRDTISTARETNKGVNPTSRRFVRGVLHPNPVGVRTSAFFAVLVQVLLVANLIGIPWLLYHDYATGNSMVWWVVGLMSALVLSALCYLIWGLSSRCRICGQRQFAPKKCLKNKKAHHIPIIGYIFPTALHAMFYKWFYCTYCGTAVRLKK